MPSYQYLRDAKQTPPEDDVPPEYTKKEKRKNWWHYHWGIVLGAIVGLSIIVYFVVSMAIKVNPDYTIGIITTTDFPTEFTTKFAEELTPFFDDKNKDGKVVVEVLTYTVQYSGDGSTSQTIVSSSDSSTTLTYNDPYAQMAGVTKLTGAFSAADQFIFLVEPEQAEFYQEAFAVFGNAEGEIPSDNIPISEIAPLFKNCPVLSSLDLTYDSYSSTPVDGQELIGNYYVALRPVYGTTAEKKSDGIANWQQSKQLYDTLTANSTK